MVDQRIVEYIKGGLEGGYSLATLKQALLKEGWPQAYVDAAANMAQAGLSSNPKSKPKPKPEKHIRHIMWLSKEKIPSAGKTKGKSKSGAGESAAKAAKPDKKKAKLKKPEKSGRSFHLFGHGGAKIKAGKKEEKQKKQEKRAEEEQRKKKEKQQKKKAENLKKQAKPGQKQETIPVIYEKPKGKVTTEIDDMLEIISQRKKIRVDALASMMKVKESEISEWMETLESWGLVKIHYPIFGKPVMMIATKKKGEEEGS